MKKLNKIFGVLLTAALLTSLLITSAVPVAAGDNAWTEFKVPGSTGNVMANNIVDSGLLTQSADGSALFAAVTDDDGISYLAKSTNGGKSWTFTKTPAFTGTVWDHVAGDWDIQAIAVSPSDASVVYIAGMRTVFKSTDGGATFAKMAAVPDLFSGSEFITSMDVAMAGGSYKVVVGTKIWGSNDGNVYFMDEGEFFYAFTTIGTPDFATANPGFDVIDVKLSPSFATDKGIVVLAHDTGADETIASFNVNGGAWNSTIKNAVVSSSYPWGEIGLPSDFNILSHNQFFVAGEDGVYRVFGGATISTAALLPYWNADNDDLRSIDVLGPFASAIIAVGDAGEEFVWTSTNGGLTWTEGENVTGDGYDTFVAIAKDFATSGTIYALTQAGGVDDESGFQVSRNQGKNFAQISLLNSTIDEIADVAFGANGDVFMITVDDYNSYTSLWRYTTANGWARVYTEEYTGDDFDTVQVVNGVVYMSDWQDIMVSADNGMTFTELPFSVGYTINDFVVINAQSFVVATNAGIFVTTNGGFFWDEEFEEGATMFAVSGDGSTIAAATIAGTIILSSDNGATWTDETESLANISAIAFQNGSNAMVWATAAETGAPISVPGTPDSFIITAGAADEAITITGNVTLEVVLDLNANTVIGIGGFTFGDAGDKVKVTANNTTTASWTSAGTATAAIDFDGTDGSMAGTTVDNGSSIAMTMNPSMGTTYTGGGLYKIDASEEDDAEWSDRMDVGGSSALFDSPASTNTIMNAGMGVASGSSAGSYTVYALDSTGKLTRVMADASRAGRVNAPTGVTTGAQLFLVGNVLWANTGTKLFTYTDNLAVKVSGVTATPTSTSAGTISWTAVTGATKYAVSVKTGTAAKDVYTATLNASALTTTSYTVTGLTADTTYSVSVWAVAPVTTFVGTASFSTQPNAVTTPVSLAPVAGAIGVPVNPSFQWGGVAGATSYTVEVATDANFSNIVKTLTTPIAAVAWNGTSLSNNTVYYWRVTATTATGTSAAVESVFTTVAAATPPVTVTTTTQPNITLTQLPAPDQATPSYIWIIIAIGGILTVLVIVLIVRTRRVV